MTSAAPGPLTGRTVGRYLLGERFAAGGHGEIYLAADATLARTVVVKVRRSEGAPAQARLLAEAQIAAQVDHPYATHVYDSGLTDDGLSWMAMEWVRGPDLATLVAERGPLAPAEAVALVARLCEVVAELHRHALIHRDLKPANILVIHRSGTLLPKLCDFGLAAITVDEPTGTPAYMAPEQWAGGPLDARTDVYALGLCAAFVLTGHARAVDRAGPALVPTLPPTISPALAAAITRACAPTPADRFDGALAFAAALRAASSTAARPGLDDAVAGVILTGAPEPIAEALAAWEATTGPRAAAAALDDLVAVVARWLGVCALAVRRARGQPIGDALQALGAHPPPARWLAVAEADDGATPLGATLARIAARVRALIEPGPAGPTSVALLLTWTAAVEGVLRALGPLVRLRLVVRTSARAERWTGVARRHRPAVWLADAAAIAPGTAALVDDDGAAVLALAELVEVAAPSPGARHELFVLAGVDGDAVVLTAAAGFRLRRPGAALGLAAAPDRVAEERGPYPGLAAFATDDAPWFVGREREVEACANRLRERRLVAVVGPSGVGKSSLVHAGLVPAVAPATVCVLRPGEAPVRALAAAVGAATVDDIAPRIQALAEARGLVIVIDQLEEVVTRATPDRAAELGDHLRAAVAGPGDVRVVVTVRDDFLVRAATLLDLASELGAGTFLLGPPAPPALVRIVVEPAARRGYQFDDPTLPATMVAAVAGSTTPLPLLSFTAQALWQRRDRRMRQLCAHAYQALGGVVGSLAHHADATVAALPPAQRALVPTLFANLATAEGTRVAIDRAELGEVLGGADGAAVVSRLIDARLVTSSDGEAGPAIELVHEALLTAWPQLARWRADEAAAATLRDAVRAAAHQWDAGGRARGRLWRGDALAELRAWQRRHRVRLTPREAAFVAASVAEARRTRVAARVAAIAALLAAAIALVVLVRANRRASTQRRAAERASHQVTAQLQASLIEQARQAAVSHHPLEGLAWLDAALAAGAPAPPLASLGRGLVAQLGDSARLHPVLGAPIHTMAWSASGARLAVAGRVPDPRVVVLDRDGRPQHRLADGGAVTSLAFSPDERYLAAAGVGGVTTWDLTTDAQLAHVAAPAARVAWSPDGTRLAVAGRDGVVRLYLGAALTPGPAIASPRPPLGNQPSLVAPAWLDDQRLAIGSRSGHVWIAQADRGVIVEERAASAPVLALVASGGALLALPLDGREVDAWDPDGRHHVLAGHRLAVEDVALSADGTRAVTGGADGVAVVWHVASGRATATLAGHDGAVVGVGFLGRAVVTSGVDGSVRVWGRPGMTVVAVHPAATTGLRVAADGQVAVGDDDGEVGIWAVPDPTVAVPADTAAIVAGDGRLVALGPALAYDLGRAGALAATPAPRVADGPMPVAYRRQGAIVDGDLITPDGGAALRLGADGRVVARCDAGEPVYTATGRGRVLVAGGRTGAVVVCAAGGAPRALPRHHGPVWALALSPDGTQLASAGQDRAVRVTAVDAGAAAEVALDAVATSAAWLDDAQVAVATLSGAVVLVRAGQARTVIAGDGVAANAIIAIDADHVAVGCDDGTVRLVALGLGEVTRWELGRAVVALARVAPDRLVATTADGGAMLSLGAAAAAPELRAVAACRSRFRIAGGRLTRVAQLPACPP